MATFASPMWLMNRLLPAKSMVKISLKMAGGMSQLSSEVPAAAIRSPSPPKPMPSAISRLAATKGTVGVRSSSPKARNW